MLLENTLHQLQTKLTKDISIDDCLSHIACYETLATIENNQFHLAYCHYYKAVHLSLKGEINMSNIILRRIIPFFRNHRHYNYWHASLNCLGKNKLHQGNIEEGLNYLKTALSLKSTSSEHFAKTQLELVRFILLFNAYDEAIVKSEIALKSLSLKNIRHRELYLQTLLETIDIHLRKKMPEKAKEILRKVDAAQKAIGIGRTSSILHQKYGIYYSYIQNHNQAIYHFKLAIKESDRKNLYPLSLSCQILLAEVYLTQNKLNLAEKLLIYTFNNHKQENKSNFLRLLNNLVEVYQLQGNKDAKNRFIAELQVHSD